MSRPPLPPFTTETANEKVRLAEDRLELEKSSPRRGSLYARQRMEKSRTVPPRPGLHRGIPDHQMAV
jgi:nuclear transport factor 2 (NTF2) superfamily protein